MACELAALLEERDLFAGQRDADVDLTSRWIDLQRAQRSTLSTKSLAQARRLRTIVKIDEDHGDDSKVGLLLAFAYPDRIAKRREKNGNAYLMASGTTAVLPPGSVLSRNEFLAIAEADTIGTSVRIFLCAPIAKELWIDSLAATKVAEDVVRWNSVTESVEARSVQRLGAIIISEKPIPGDDERVVAAMTDGIRMLGLQVPSVGSGIAIAERPQRMVTNKRACRQRLARFE